MNGITIGDLINSAQFFEQARELGIQTITQAEYEEKYDETQKAVHRLPNLRRKLRREEDALRRDRILRDIEHVQTQLDRLYNEVVRKRRGNRQTWDEIKRLKRKIQMLKGLGRLKRRKEGIRSLRGEIKEAEHNITVDERRAYFDKKPHAPRIAYNLKETARKGRKHGHTGRDRWCEMCREVSKAERTLRFFEEGEVDIGK